MITQLHNKKTYRTLVNTCPLLSKQTSIEYNQLIKLPLLQLACKETQLQNTPILINFNMNRPPRGNNNSTIKHRNYTLAPVSRYTSLQ